MIIGESPPQDFIVRQKFEDIFTGYDVVMTKKAVLKLEAKHPDWKLPHFDPQAPRTLAESDLESPEKMAQRLNEKYKELKSKERKLALTGALDSAFPGVLSHADLGALIRQDGEVDSFAANKKRGRDYRMKLQSRD